MSRYRGWDIKEMRAKRPTYSKDDGSSPKRRRSEAGYSTPNGFTAINKPNVKGMGGASENSHTAESVPVTRPDGIQPKGAISPARNPLIAEYLGVGAQSPVSSLFDNTASAEAMRLETNQTSSAKTVDKLQSSKPQKRKSEAGRKSKAGAEQPISTGMRVTKPAGTTKGTKSNQDRDIRCPESGPSVDRQVSIDFKLSEQSTRKFNAFRYNASASTESSINDLAREVTPALDRVPVVTPLTSLDALKAQQGFGCTVYQGPSQSRHLKISQRFQSAQQQVKSDISSSGQPSSKSDFTQQADGDGPRSLLAGSRSSTCVQSGSALAGSTQAGVNTASTDSSFAQQRIEQLTDCSATCDIGEELEDEDLLGVVSHSSLVGDAATNTWRQGGATTENAPTQLPTPQPSDPVLVTSSSSPRLSSEGPLRASYDLDDEWVFLDDELDITSIDLTSDQIPTSGPVLPASSSESMFGSLVTGYVQDASNQESRLRAVAPILQPQIQENNGQDWPRPITRPPFPERARDRSPIIGLSASMVLRTCFRVGEAINVGCQAVRAGHTVVIELYARVSSSWREQNGVRQHFVFADLFHNRPPYIDGVYELWKGVELWDYDSQRFLCSAGNKTMCRCIGKMKRENHKWKLTILNVWEATWEDIEYARGIICSWSVSKNTLAAMGTHYDPRSTFTNKTHRRLMSYGR